MRYLSTLSTLLLAVLLSSCGGGGGSPGVGSGSVQALSVAAPAVVTLAVGLTQQYAVQGGTKPYTVFSTNPAVAVGWIVGENVVAIGTSTAGTATVTLQDLKGAKFDMLVTAGSSTTFFTTAPPALRIAPGPLAAQTYKVGGGTPPYKASSSFPVAVSVVVNGNDVTITAMRNAGDPATAVTANIAITDSSATQTPLITAVTVGTIPLAIFPNNSIKLPVGAILRAIVTGGTPPYRTLVLDNCSTNATIVQGNILQATAAMACKGAVIAVVDANDQTISVTDIEITPGTAGLNIAPSAFTVTESATTPSLSLLVYGANGPIQVFTTNTAILAPQTPVSNSDGTFTIPLAGGNFCYDGRGKDNTTPADGDFTDTALVAGTQLIADVLPRPTVAVTITVLDSTGRQGISVLTVQDNGLGGAGCI